MGEALSNSKGLHECSNEYHYDLEFRALVMVKYYAFRSKVTKFLCRSTSDNIERMFSLSAIYEELQNID